MATSSKSLNDIGPAVQIVGRNGTWSVRFRLPRHVAEQYDLPSNPRLVTENLRGDLSNPKRRNQELRREANRIGARLDLLIAGHDAPLPGQTLAAWLGLVETKRVRANSKRRVPKTKTWQYLVQRFIDDFEDGSIARERNREDAVRRLETVRDLEFCQDRYPPDIGPNEWDDYFDLLLESPVYSDSQAPTAQVLTAVRHLLAGSEATTTPQIRRFLNGSTRRQTVDAHVRVLVRGGWLQSKMLLPRRGLKRRVQFLTTGPRFNQSFSPTARTTCAKTVNKQRALINRIYNYGIEKRLFRDNPILGTTRRTAGRAKSSKPCYRTKSMILEALDQKRHTAAEIQAMYRYRVLDETEQKDLLMLAKERSELQMLEPVICALHGVSGVDVRAMLKGAYNPQTGILSGQRHKTGHAVFSVPVAPSLRPYLDEYVMKLPRAEYLFPQFRTGEFGEPCEPRGRMDRLFARLVSGTDFNGLGFRCLRHSFISLVLSKGIPAERVRTWVGHLDTKLTTSTYLHFIRMNRRSSWTA